jgi:hypothetical protein
VVVKKSAMLEEGWFCDGTAHERWKGILLVREVAIAESFLL